MARYVLIEIDDNNAADQFIVSINQGKQFMTVPANNAQDQYTVVELQAKAVGLFAKPTNFCTCSVPGKRARGAKLGWWVCTNAGCNKALKGSMQRPNNLLEVDKHLSQREVYIAAAPGNFEPPEVSVKA